MPGRADRRCMMARAKPVYGLDAHAETRYSLPAIFSARIAELWSWAPHIHDPANVTELHDMRIAAKRLRYCFEFFAPFFGKGFKPTLDTFKKLQDYLGEIHDCDVWVDYLRSELEDALKRMNRAAGRLGSHVGASSGLGRDAAKMLELVDGGPVAGLLAMTIEVTQRRARLFDDLQVFWRELEARDFRAELLQAVSRATIARAPEADKAPAAGPENGPAAVLENQESGNNGGTAQADPAAQPDSGPGEGQKQ
ncbi:CHAD domain-containing protein [bacterium]|nr:CHAD domain-containing protein [bacterium]